MALTSFFQRAWCLDGNPFPGKATYAEDNQIVYVPEMFGDQRKDFLHKFVLAPLENGQPLLGAVWSVVPGDPKARGFGKSTLMGEEAKLINQDFGFTTLTLLGVSEKDARANPVMAGYVSFNTKANEGIASIDAACFHLVRFLLRSSDEKGIKAHQRLRERAAAKLAKDGRAVRGQESQAIVTAVEERFRELAVTIDIRNLLEDFLMQLASPDTDALDKFLSTVGTWHHNRNGLKYLQIFVAFAELADIQYFTFFIDQVEDFTSESQPAKIRKNVKIIRDALLESEPFASRASFVFQLHPDAYKKLGDAWAHEDLRDLKHDSLLNRPYVVVLKGLDNFEAARLLTERCLNHERYALPGRKPGISPFTESSLKKVWQATKPRPRWFIRVLHDLLQLAKDDKVAVLDDKFVDPAKLETLSANARKDDQDDEDDLRDDRLAQERIMWWHQPRLKEFPPLLPSNILDVAARAYSVVEVGGLSGYGPERGRNFEALFYSICTRRGVNLCEKAGSRTLAQQRSASGFGHEVDGATRSVEHLTHWELKHLTTELDKNQLLVFNGKGLDFLYGSSAFFAKIPVLRFLLSGWNVGQESRFFCALWGIMLMEPGRLPLPLLYEAVAHGASACLTPAEHEAVRFEVGWACRPLQSVLAELSAWGNGTTAPTRCGPMASRHARGVLDIQEEFGADVTDHLAETHPDWIDEIANDTWNEVGGW